MLTDPGECCPPSQSEEMELRKKERNERILRVMRMRLSHREKKGKKDRDNEMKGFACIETC